MTAENRTLIIERQKNTVRVGDISVELPRLTFTLLLELARAAPGVLNSADLMNRVWGDVHVSPDTVKQRVALLRNALDESGIGREWVKTEPGAGYAFSGAARIVDGETPQPTQGDQALRRAIDRIFGFLTGARKLAAAALLFLFISTGAVILARNHDFGPKPSDELRIAVLPFSEINGDGAASPVGAGLEEELTGLLSRHAGIVSVAASALPASGELRPGEIGNALNAAAVIEGNVRSDGEQRRFSVRLIRTETEELAWSGEYELPVSAGFRDWSRISLHVSKLVFFELQSDMARASRAGGARTADAYDAYLAGIDHVKKPLGDGSYKAAAALFEEALQRDPDFVLARAWLAACLAKLALSDAAEPDDAGRALQQSKRALAAGGDFAEAQYAYGLALMAKGKAEQAEPYFRRAERGLPFLALELDRLRGTANRRRLSGSAFDSALEDK